ncbi:hypothetical protein B0F90DRAFT_1814934 [Multifurca ochricompacta]|uniref:BOD1/SHG1 domain-containing protein n=1 Tax=Multifurca ochricompacta TaxID=376703 RepID=A0AAD4M980_9AGAM|nr:hypothetical protein B0F90DRAFT_1814934 [Multifurca ochricompacta]
MSDPIKTPDDLVKEFKKSGEFDRLRRELLTQFQNGEEIEAFWARVDDIARARLEAEDKLYLKAADTLHRELCRNSIERAAADVPLLADPAFAAGIRRHAENLVRRSSGLSGPVTLPLSATPVSDADEEIFLLYTRLAALKPADDSDAGHFHGLGSENSNEDTLIVRLELKKPSRSSRKSGSDVLGPGGRISRKTRGNKRKGTIKEEVHENVHESEPVTLEYELFQDKTALRTRSGDTGSVLWKASIEFLGLVLQQQYFPEPHHSLFDYAKLSQAHVLELGSGTGLLALALSPLVRKYTATDIPALIPLLRKNLHPSRNAITNSANATTTTITTTTTTTLNRTSITALDWTFPTSRQIDVQADVIDVLLVVDCIYHPTLVRPLLATMTALAVPRHTVALVVAELRAEDVLREFLEEWIASGWSVWSVAEGLLGARWGMWVAWREN